METISTSTQNRQNGSAQKPSFVVFNKATEKLLPTGKPSIHINTAGQITINAIAALQIGITTDNCRIEFLQDSSRPKDWYLRLAFHDDAFMARIKDASKKVGSSWVLNGSTFAKSFLESIGCKEKSISLPFAPEPILDEEQPPMFAILTAAASAKK